MNTLPVMEHFYTLQGEGVFTGQAAYFIRLGGCDVGCVWCDVKESWDATQHPHFSVEKLVQWVQATPAKIVVVTGGEPALYNLELLTQELQKAGLRTHVETSAAYEITGSWNWICISPKKFKFPLDSELKKAQELKVIVYNQSDFEWARSFENQVNPNCKLIIQPEWDKREKIQPQMIEFVKQNPQWQISLQTHKYLEIP